MHTHRLRAASTCRRLPGESCGRWSPLAPRSLGCRTRLQAAPHSAAVRCRGVGREQSAARCIQRTWRGWQQRLAYLELYLEVVPAVVTIQRRLRVGFGYLDRYFGHSSTPPEKDLPPGWFALSLRQSDAECPAVDELRRDGLRGATTGRGSHASAASTATPPASSAATGAVRRSSC